MKKLLYCFPVVLLLASCSGNKPEGPEQKPVPPEVSMNNEEKTLDISADKLASAKDPVCGMAVSGGITDTLSYNGKLYGFCGSGCKDSFKEDPRQYVKE